MSNCQRPSWLLATSTKASPCAADLDVDLIGRGAFRIVDGNISSGLVYSWFTERMPALLVVDPSGSGKEPQAVGVVAELLALQLCRLVARV